MNELDLKLQIEILNQKLINEAITKFKASKYQADIYVESTKENIGKAVSYNSFGNEESITLLTFLKKIPNPLTDPDKVNYKIFFAPHIEWKIIDSKDKCDRFISESKEYLGAWENTSTYCENKIKGLQEQEIDIKVEIKFLERIKAEKTKSEENNKENDSTNDKQGVDSSETNVELRKPKYGELKELCSGYAEDLGLELEETPEKEQIEYVYKQITEVHKLKTTLDTVAQIFRKLGYCRRHPS